MQRKVRVQWPKKDKVKLLFADDMIMGCKCEIRFCVAAVNNQNYKTIPIALEIKYYCIIFFKHVNNFNYIIKLYF